jgi:transcriptional regulator with XRE-family HTH domain
VRPLLGSACTPYALEDNRLSPVIDRAGVTQNRRKDVARAPLICANTYGSEEAFEIGDRIVPAKRHRFAARRKAAGFSQEQLAERLSIDRSTVARWESGETEPQPWIRPRLARVLQVSLDQLDHLLAGSDPTEAAERMNYALTHPGSADLVTVADLRNQVQHLDGQYVHVPSSSLLAPPASALDKCVSLPLTS